MLKQRPLALVVSILGHAVLLAVLVYGVDLSPLRHSEDSRDQVGPIRAHTVDKQLIDAEAEKLRRAEEDRRQRELAVSRARAEQRQKEQQVRREKLRQEQQKREREKQRAKEAATKKRDVQEEKRRRELKRQEQERLAKLEVERQREEERIAVLEVERQREEERIAVLEVERQREEERIAVLEVERQAALETEHRRREHRRLASLRAEYETAIGQKVSRNWIKPDRANDSVECTVMALQIPSGEVVDVNVLSCTGGGSALARSVELAVLKASPLPLPKNSALFDRQLEFTFRPE